MSKQSLETKRLKQADGTIVYLFETQNSGDNTCKSPKGMFDTPTIPNDLNLVKQAITNYEN